MSRHVVAFTLAAVAAGCGAGNPGAQDGTSPPPALERAAASVAATDWMAAQPDSRSLADLTIPGSHESAALYEPVAGTARCQSLGIAEQLDVGVRYLDIRVRQIGNAFAIHHGSVYQHANLDDVLGACVAFLRAHPTETILMELSPTYSSANSTETNEATFMRYATAAAYAPYWWRGTAIPTLGEARGKIVLVRRFGGSAGVSGGLDVTGWQDNARFTLQDAAGTPIVVQDFYVVKTGTNANKWGAITALLGQAATTAGRTWFVNFTSGYQPILGIPSIPSVSNDVNARLDAWFSSPPSSAVRLGTVVSDFVTAATTRKILVVQRPALRHAQLVNRASGLCLDVTNVAMAAGTPVQQWPCNGGAWQRWSWEPATGFLRSDQDPAYCLDTGGSDATDDTRRMKIWPCAESDNLRFDLHEARGIVAQRSAPTHVLDGFGISAGSPAILWTDWGGANQRWDFVY